MNEKKEKEKLEVLRLALISRALLSHGTVAMHLCFSNTKWCHISLIGI